MDVWTVAIPISITALLLLGFWIYWRSLPPGVPKEDVIRRVPAAMYTNTEEMGRANSGTLYLTKHYMEWIPFFSPTSLYPRTRINLNEIIEVHAGERSWKIPVACWNRPFTKPLIVSSSRQEFLFYFEAMRFWRSEAKAVTWVEVISSLLSTRSNLHLEGSYVSRNTEHGRRNLRKLIWLLLIVLFAIPLGSILLGGSSVALLLSCAPLVVLASLEAARNFRNTGK